MAISKSNIIVVYNLNDTDSESFADHYISKHNLVASGAVGQKVGIDCSSNEILDNKSVFDSEVLNPLKSKIDSIESAGRVVHIVLIGYGVPGGFRDGSDLISTTSRISRIHHDFDKKHRNKIYNRQVFKRFDAVDAQESLICMRIDAPTLDLAKGVVDNSIKLMKSSEARGVFYLDPYSDRHDRGASVYQKDILRFSEKMLPKLNLDTFETIFLDEYTDVVIPSVTDDSFVWSWFTDRSSLTFFNPSSADRVFFYNADYDGAASIRSLSGDRWPVLAIRSGYISTAGSMSNPTIEGFLRPSPLFDALFRGATLGEALLFSNPFLDWTISLFGDPLLTFSFPVREDDIDEDVVIEGNESIRLMTIDMARVHAYFLHKQGRLNDIIEKVVQSSDVSMEVDLLDRAVAIRSKHNDAARSSQFSMLSNSFLEYVRQTNIENLDSVLTNNDFKISQLILDPLIPKNAISNANIYIEGEWQVEIDIEDVAGSYVFYHFELDVANDNDFTDIIFSLDSDKDQTGWYWEDEKNEFTYIKSEGVPTSHVGKRVQYRSDSSQLLTRSNIYYFRIRQKDQSSIYKYQTFSDIIYT